MMCLTIRHPYSAAIFDLGKPLGNRTRNIIGEYRGPLAIHVSQTDDGMPAIRRIEQILGRPLNPGELSPGYHGHVIGVVDVVDVHDGRAEVVPCSPWADPVRAHIMIRNPRRFRYPMWAVGKLGLWSIRDDKIADRELAEEVDHG